MDAPSGNGPHTSDMPTLRLTMWSHRALYQGISPDNALHRHHAAQLCLSIDGDFRVLDDQNSFRTPGVLIPPDQAHRIEADDARLFVLYVEPECHEYEAVIAPVLCAERSAGLVPLNVSPAHTRKLKSLYARMDHADQAWSVCLGALGSPSGIAQPSVRDQRIEQVIRVIRGNPAITQPLAELARSVHLSPSRLGHLFREQVGVPIRRFAVWSRLRHVVFLAVEGASLTDAAHAAGFSDAAHMSNAFRRMFGFAPSRLLARHIHKTVQIRD